MYCEKCRAIVTEPVCPTCGKRNLREAAADDICFLTEKEMIWGEMLADVLTQNDIPFYRNGVMGAGLALSVGPNFERFRFYVPFSHFEAAQSLVESLFDAPEADAAEAPED